MINTTNNIYRIAIDKLEKGPEARVLERRIKALGYNISVSLSRVYTIQHDFSPEQVEVIANALHNPVVEAVRINKPVAESFDWALELGFLPGVTDNVAHTTTEIINDLLKTEIGRNKVFTTSKLLLSDAEELSEDDVKIIAQQLINILIERFHIKSYKKYKAEGGMDYTIPRVKLDSEAAVLEINLDVSDEELVKIGKAGILDPVTKTRRGPLALDLDYMNAIKAYFEKEGRKPTDVELEAIAQTWSEHCKHTIFAARLDDIEEGIFKRFIKRVTQEIRKELGENDFCLSVFKDNSGAIIFDDNYMVTHKVETHNSPSALDPFGGAITGIVGVNRDTIGFGRGALPIANIYGYCFGRPEDNEILFRGENRTSPVLPPRRIMDGVIHGVNVGGNCSGIPTPQGFLFFDDCYKGKPLVFVGTIGLVPRKLPDGRLGHEKKAMPGDNIVVVGGRVGKDGIHGATFSSEALDKGSPATAVQIGDPITQKKLSDAIIKEARDLHLYNCITDNGAGGLSSSVAEMARDSGGFTVELEKSPLKYPGLQPWEVWVSESQERMTLAVSDKQLPDFLELMKDRGVEATVIGSFNDSGRAIVHYNGREVMNLDMEFLHDGLPKRRLVTEPYPNVTEEADIKVENQQELFENILGSHNQASFEFISKQYDHEVQGTSVIKPLQGKGRVNGTATVLRPVFESKKGIVISQALYPRLSKISCYDMAACAIDTAIRNCVAVGADINHLALLDNFCWCSSNDPRRLRQLKDACRACYDYATTFKTPFISGKDSMFNDFKGYDNDSNPLKISVYPTLLISAIGVIEDVRQTNTIDLKLTGDLIYLIGNTMDECGGSDFYHAYSKIGSKAPRIDAKQARKLYEKMYELHKKGLLSACSSVGAGGIAMTLAKMAIAGQKGASIDISKIPSDDLSPEKILYSESQSRFIVSINPENKKAFENEMNDFSITRIGIVKNNKFKIKNKNKTMINITISDLDKIYRARFRDF